MRLGKIILFCVLLVGCEKESIEIKTEKFQKYKNEVKTSTRKNKRKFRMGKKSFGLSKILKQNNKQICKM